MSMIRRMSLALSFIATTVALPLYASASIPQMSIVPASTAPISLAASTPSTLSYTVTANALMKNVKISAASAQYPLPSYITSSLQSDTCSGTTLAKNASCTFTLALSIADTAGRVGNKFTLSPRVSANNGASNSMPSAGNRVVVTVTSGGGGGGSLIITPSGAVTADVPGTANASSLMQQLTATENGVDVTNSVTWSSSDTNYATVTTGVTGGQVTGAGVPSGSITTTVTITATDPGTGATGTKDVTVNLVIGSLVEGGFVYCLGNPDSVGSPSGIQCDNTLPLTCGDGSQTCVGGIIAEEDNVPSNTGQQWYNGSYTTTGATDLNNGQANTSTIVSSQSAGSYAANTCKMYNSGDGNTTWYLPAKNELNVIYQNVTTLNTAGAALNRDGSTGPTYSLYWSSSEVDLNGAWAQVFSDGGQGNVGKDGTVGVRCARAF